MPPRKTSVLVVDDDHGILRMMRRTLELEGYRLFTASNGEDGLSAFSEEPPDLVLLDIVMPGIDGYTVCRRIRESSKVPVIIVTCKGNEEEKIRGLDAGADDYVTKPFSSKELVARVRAVLRRGGRPWEHTSRLALRCDDLVIDFARHRVTRGGREVSLTATEYGILSCLGQNVNCVVTSNQLLETVWGEEYIGEPHLLQVNIARLRRKLMEDTRNPKYIFTRPGIGYVMLDPATTG